MRRSRSLNFILAIVLSFNLVLSSVVPAFAEETSSAGPQLSQPAGPSLSQPPTDSGSKDTSTSKESDSAAGATSSDTSSSDSGVVAPTKSKQKSKSKSSKSSTVPAPAALEETNELEEDDPDYNYNFPKDIVIYSNPNDNNWYKGDVIVTIVYDVNGRTTKRIKISGGDGNVTATMFKGSSSQNIQYNNWVKVPENYLETTDIWSGDQKLTIRVPENCLVEVDEYGFGFPNRDEYNDEKLLIDFIDKTAPVIAIEPYTTTPTNQPITVNASVEDVGSGATLNATSHTFEENGSFTFTATDLAGNSTSETVTIDNIDKVAPVITLNDDATMYVAMDSTFTDPGATYDNGLSATVSGTVDTTKMSKYILTYSATDAAGNLATDVTRTVYVYPTDGTGLTGKYYDNLDFSNLKLIRTDETVNFDWVRGTPDSIINSDTFSVEWNGFVAPTYTGEYTFYTDSDDGIELIVNGKQVIRNWSNHAITQNSGKISLDAGQKYSITLKFYENTGEAVAKLSWSYADQGKTTIPQSQLFPEDYTKVTGVSVESTKQVNEGLTVQLTATVDPSDATYKNLLWTSADTTIATVDGTGLVTGVKPGVVTITVRTIDGGETATCQVTVVDTIAPTAPVITFTQPSDYQAGTWTKEDVKFTIGDGIDYGTDNGSGVKKYQYRYNRIREAEVANAPELAPSLQWQSQNIWHDYTGEVKVSWTGKYYIEARTVDNAGNLSQIVSTQVWIDKDAPTSPRITINELEDIPLEESPSYMGFGYVYEKWINKDITFTLSDGYDRHSGVQEYQYYIFENYLSQPEVLNAPGMHGFEIPWIDYEDEEVLIECEEGTNKKVTIFARTVDNVGNKSNWPYSTKNVNIDKENPTAQISGNPTEWQGTPALLTIIADDNMSGLKRISVDGQQLWPYVYGDSGISRISSFEELNNNIELAPMGGYLQNLYESGIPGIEDPSMFFDTQEKFVEFLFEISRNLELGQIPVFYVVEQNGTYVLEIEDRAGNIYTEDIIVNRIDKEAPVITVNGINDGDTVGGNITFTVSVTDNSGESITPVVKVDGTEISGNEGSYTARLNSVGAHTIEVLAQDLAGNQSNVTLEISRRSSNTISVIRRPAAPQAAALEEELIYTDLEGYEWAEEAIIELTELEIISGREEGLYCPGENITRGEFATYLVNLMDAYDENSTEPFADVTEDTDNYQSIASAYKAGLIKGRSATEFAPNDFITREDITLVLTRALQKLTKVELGNFDEVEFLDKEQVPGYARISVATAVDYELIEGYEVEGGNEFRPLNNMNRAEAAVIIYRVLGYK